MEEQEADVKAYTKLRDTEAGAMIIEDELPPGAIVTSLDVGVRNLYGAARTEVISKEEISAVDDHKPFFTPADQDERIDGGAWVVTTASNRNATRSRQRRYRL